MPLHILVLLALIQGITEFLPISSSGHLILLPALTGSEDQGTAIDVAAHVGTLFAVMLYFRTEMGHLVTGSLDLLRGRVATPAARLTWLLALATIPVIIAGFVLKLTGLSDQMRSITVIGWTMLLFGIVLWWFDTKSPADRIKADWTLRDAIVMGLWQAVALIPGTSRSGATITAARQLGFTREDGATLAMLMSIPTIIASGTLLSLDLMTQDSPAPWGDIGIVAGISFVAALAALVLMMRLLRSVSFTPYVIYRIILGTVLLAIAYG